MTKEILQGYLLLFGIPLLLALVIFVFDETFHPDRYALWMLVVLSFVLGWGLGEFRTIKKAERRCGKPWSAKWPCDKEPWER